MTCDSMLCWVDLILNRLERIYITLNEEKPLKNRGLFLSGRGGGNYT